MNQFDYEAYLRGDKAITRDGREVEQLVRFELADGLITFVGAVEGSVKTWKENGSWFKDGREDPSDLVMAPKTRTVFVNLYGSNTMSAHPTKDCAIHYAKRSRDHTTVAYPVEIPEGYGLELLGKGVQS